jgi:hypothetical protein
MRVSTATSPGSDQAPNEDAVCSSSRVAVVVDGVTAPAGLETGCVHGTAWYARQLATCAVSTSENTALDLRAALHEAIALVADSHKDSCDLSADGTPSATIAVVRENGGCVEYLVLSDATVAIAVDGRAEVITDERHLVLLAEPKRAVQSAPVGSEEREKLLRDLVTTQRKLRTIPGGYWLAGAVPSAAAHALCGSVPISDGLCVAAMTDGAARLVEVFEDQSWPDALQQLQKSGPDEWIRRVRDLEATDAALTRWPRYRLSDDAALAQCTFEPWPQRL